MTSIVFAVIGGLLVLGALYIWKIDRNKVDNLQSNAEQDVAEWVHACRSEYGGRLVAAVLDTHLPTSHRLEALREVVTEYASLGLPTKEEAYKLLSAREDVDRAIQACLNDNDLSLAHASLQILKRHELDRHQGSVSQLIQRVITNPEPSAERLRSLAIQYLAKFGDRSSEGTLVDVMEMGNRDDRSAAIIGLQRFGTATSVPSLHATSADPLMIAIRGQALAAVTAIQTRIGPVDTGALSMTEETGNMSLATRGGELSFAQSRERSATL